MRPDESFTCCVILVYAALLFPCFVVKQLLHFFWTSLVLVISSANSVLKWSQNRQFLLNIILEQLLSQKIAYKFNIRLNLN